MKTLKIMNDAAKQVMRNKLRTFLTMLGLIVGIASVIMLVGLSEGSNRQVEEQMESVGGNIISVYLFGDPLAFEDITRLREQQALEDVAPAKPLSAKVSLGKETAQRVSVEATDEHYLAARDLKLKHGRNLSSVDRLNQSKVCVLGPTVAQDLFGSTDVVDKWIKLNGVRYRIVGVLDEKGESIGMSSDNAVLIPFSLVHEFDAKDEVDNLYARAAEGSGVPLAKTQIEQFLSQEKNMKSTEYYIGSQDDFLNAQDSIDETMTVLLAGIASISLVVAGIGVMNVMLVSVTERIREIGIRKALGAQKSNLLFQFLFEALIISLAGGLCGIALGLILGTAADALGYAFEASTFIIVLAAAASAAVGLVFGILPAYRASCLNPIDALRQE